MNSRFPFNDMAYNLEIPSHVPVMTLPDTVLFPHAMLPLHIFEDRYREMLSAVLDADRVFAIAALDQERAEQSQQFEPLCRVATIGIIRACHKNKDQTANLILQGLARVKVERIVKEKPYRVIEIQPVPQSTTEDRERLLILRDQLTHLLESYSHLDNRVSPEILHFLRSLQDPEAFLDLTAFTLCTDLDFKQRMLEAQNLQERFEICNTFFHEENCRLQLERKLKGELDDEDIQLN